MSTARGLLVLALAATGCGSEVTEPNDWMLGAFSSRNVKDRSPGLSALGQYHFREDGTLTLLAITNCAENREKLMEEYTWSRAGSSLVLVDMPEGAIHEECRVTLGETCNTMQVNPIQDGEVDGRFTLWRGAVCMKELPPCEEGYECETCETAWCDEPPPPCDE